MIYKGAVCPFVQTVDKAYPIFQIILYKRAESSVLIRTFRLFSGIIKVSKQGGYFYDDSECG